MNYQREWLKSLPLGLAVKLVLMWAARKITGLPIAFSFAQGAEDILIPYVARYHLGLEGPGKYVDVGCNAPVKYSNTFLLYLIGWRGVNIDANGDLIDECKKVRKQDLCFQAAVSDSVRQVVFHKAEGSLMSTIDSVKYEEWKELSMFRHRHEEKATTRTLTSILDECWPKEDEIDLLSIDVEGHDFQVLRSLDLRRYRPKIIVIEMHSVEKIEDNDIYRYLNAHGYAFKFYAVLNAYFIDSDQTKTDEGH